VAAGGDRLVDLLLLLGDERVSRGLEKLLRLVAVLEEKGVLDALLDIAEPGVLEALLQIAAHEATVKAPARRPESSGGGP